MLAQTPRPYLLEVSMTISSFIRLWLGPEKTSSDFVDKQLETVEIANIQQLKKCISLYMSIYIPWSTFSLKIYLSRLAWLDPWTRPLMTFSESLLKWWSFFVWPHDLNWNIQDVSKFFRRRLVGDLYNRCFFFREICEIGLGWSWLEIWHIKALQPNGSKLQLQIFRVIGWGTTNVALLIRSLKLVGRLQHEHPNCGTRKESQNRPYLQRAKRPISTGAYLQRNCFFAEMNQQ